MNNNYCDACNIKFKNRSTFLCHLASNHHGPFPLVNATKNIDGDANKSNLNIMYLPMSYTNIFLCYFSESFRTRPIIVNSNSESTPSDKCSNKHQRYHCSICKKNFSFDSWYQRHMYTHMPGKYLCNYCSKVFKRNDNLVRHTLNIHLRNVTVNKCKTCSKTFKYKSLLKAHRINIHCRKKQKHICKVCKKCLWSKKTLHYHMNAHHNKQEFMCGTCGLTFTASYKKSRHCQKNVLTII